MAQHKKTDSKSTVNTVKRLLGYITASYKGRIVMVLAFILISTAANVAGSLFLKILIDDYIAPLLGVQNPQFTGLVKAIGIMAVIYLSGVICSYVYNRCMIVIGQGIQKNIRDEMFCKMQKLPVKYFDTNSYGDIMSRYTNDIDTLRQAISQSIPALISSFIMILLVFSSMLLISIPLSLLVLAMVFVMTKTTKALAKKSSPYFAKQQKDLGLVNGYIEEIMNGQKVVKVFCYEEEVKQQFHEKNKKLFESADSANKYANAILPVAMNLAGLTYILVAIAGGALSVSGISALTLGSIVTFLQLTRSFNQPVSQISQQMNSVIMAISGAERIFSLIDQEPEQDDGYVTLVYAHYDTLGNLAESEKRTGLWAWKHPHHDGTITYTKVEGDVRFYDVDFSYDGEKTVLNHVSLFAKPGQKLAFVGATGAGKTTITNLINRFYDIADGKIRYDGININKIKKSDLRRSLGIVLQDVNLFTGTVMDNIRYGNLDAGDDDVIAAAKLAGADGFISRLPEGYDTMLTGDGAGLSQGQRQLLSIARAAAANPPVMILDEATSSIDTRTEKLVQAGMDALMEGRTVFVIAHRLSTIRNSKAIMVMDKGEIIERGSHEELIQEKGKYYQLYTGAFESMDQLGTETA